LAQWKVIPKRREVSIEWISQKDISYPMQRHSRITLIDSLEVQTSIRVQLNLSRSRVKYRLAESHGFCWKIFIGILEFVSNSTEPCAWATIITDGDGKERRGAEEEQRNAEGTRAVGTAVDHEEQENQQAHQTL
jgi:hypothetical protein